MIRPGLNLHTRRAQRAGAEAKPGRRAAWTTMLGLLLTLTPEVLAEGNAALSSFALRARRIYPVTADGAGPIEHGVLIVRDGKVESLGSNLAIPPELPILDRSDAVVCPGFVDAGAALIPWHRGNYSVGAEYRAVDAFDPYDDMRRVLARGTTTAHLSPGGHRLVSGRGAVVRLAGEPAMRVLRAESDLCVNLGVFGPPQIIEPPFFASADVQIRPALMQRPETRLGQMVELERWLTLVRTPQSPAIDPSDAWLTPARLAFVDAMNAKLPWRIQVRAAADIERAAAFAQQLGVPVYLVGLTEADDAVSSLMQVGLPLVLRVESAYRVPANDASGDPDTLLDDLAVAARVASAAHARQQRAALALTGAEGDSLSDLQMVGRLALRGGLAREAALAAITRVPAEILGVSERVGSLAAGRDADFLLLNDDPFEPGTRVCETYVAGRKVFEAPRSDALVVRAGTVWVGDGSTLHDGSVLIVDGKVEAVGQRVSQPPNARVIDAGPDSFVTPGFVDGFGYLGLHGDRTRVGTELPIAAAVGIADEQALRVARAGVTTVLLSPIERDPRGARLAAVKTLGVDRDRRITRDVAGISFSLRGADPQLGVNGIREAVEAGKKYDEAWKKYDEALKKWEEDRKKGITSKPKETVEVVTEQPKVDPISGTWAVKLSGGPLPEPVEATLLLKLTGNAIEGRLQPPGGDEEVTLTGTLSGTDVTAEIDQDTPFGKPTITAKLDKEDHMAGEVKLGDMMTLEFEATRTSKEAVEFQVQRKRKKSKDDRPVAPKVDERLEPYRALLAGKIPAVVDVATGAEIEAALKLLVDEYKLAVVLRNADELPDVADKIRQRGESVGVIVPSQMTRERRRLPYSPIAEAARLGLRVALQSESEDGARALPLMAFYALSDGLGGDAALRALTIDAARMYKLDDRVGSLQPGRDGDVLIFSAHPFDAGARLLRAFVRGQEVPDGVR